jgi:hypothetical protein
VHIYANGHSRIAVEELGVRMGALTGFHPLLSNALTNFTDVVGADSLRINQAIEKIEGLGAKILDEFEIGAKSNLRILTSIPFESSDLFRPVLPCFLRERHKSQSQTAVRKRHTSTSKFEKLLGLASYIMMLDSSLERTLLQDERGTGENDLGSTHWERGNADVREE